MHNTHLTTPIHLITDNGVTYYMESNKIDMQVSRKYNPHFLMRRDITNKKDKSSKFNSIYVSWQLNTRDKKRRHHEKLFMSSKSIWSIMNSGFIHLLASCVQTYNSKTKLICIEINQYMRTTYITHISQHHFIEHPTKRQIQ